METNPPLTDEQQEAVRILRRLHKAYEGGCGARLSAAELYHLAIYTPFGQMMALADAEDDE